MKKYLLAALGLALIIAVGANFILFQESLHFVVDMSVDREGGIALVDSTGNQSRIIHADLDGRIRLLRQDTVIKGDTFLTRPEILSLSDGGVMVKESTINYNTFVVEEERIVYYPAGESRASTLVKRQEPNELYERLGGMYSFDGQFGYYLQLPGRIERYSVDLAAGQVSLAQTIQPGAHIPSQILYTNQGTVMLTNGNEIYLFAQDGELRLLYPREGISAHVVSLDTDEAGNLLVWDAQASGLFRMLEDDSFIEAHNAGRRFSGEGVMIRDLLRIDSAADDLFIGITSSADVLLVVEGNSSRQLHLNWPTARTITTGLIVFFGAFIAVVLLISLINLWRAKERMFPLVAKQLAFGLPVIFVGTALLYMLAGSVIGNALNDQFSNALYDIGYRNVQKIDGKWLSRLDLTDPFSDPVYMSLGDTVLDASPFLSEVSTSHGKSNVSSFYYYWLFAVRDGVILTAACEETQVGLPLRYIYCDATRAYYEEVLNSRMPVYCSIQDVSGSWILSLIPIFENNDGTGEIVGILEAGSNSVSITSIIQSRSMILAAIGGGVMLLIMGMVMGMLTFSLRPLGKLKNTMQEVANGRYGLQVEVRSHDEIAQLGKIFNFLSLTIVQQIQNLTNLNAAYYRFVPLKMMELLGGKGVQDVRLGDQMISDMTVMQLSVRGFDAMVTSLSTQALFRLLNEIYETFVPLLNRYGGVVDRYTEAGWVCLFTGEPYDAVAAGVDIMARLEEYNELRAARGERPVDLGVAIARGPVMVGIVGHKDRVSAMAISEVVNMTQYLLTAGQEIGSRIIMADTLGRLEDYEFSTRWLGRMTVSKRGTQIDLFDCFDGDMEEQRVRKAETAGAFLSGVTAYTNAEMYKARKAFIDVLRVNPSDAAATAYLIRCDEQYRREESNEGGSMFVYS